MDQPRPAPLPTPHPDGERSFEDTLREVVRTSPYVVLSLVVHGAVLLLLALMPSSELVVEDTPTIQAGFDDDVAIVEPPLDPIEPDIEPPEDLPLDPVVSDDYVDAPDEVPSDVVATATGVADDDMPAGVTGLGGGPTGGIGKLGTRGGGDPPGGRAPKAIKASLSWLAAHQTSLGEGAAYWSGSAFDLECGKLGEDKVCDGLAGTTQHDVGLTGLALLAFLGAGNTDKQGEFRDNVRTGLRYLIDGQEADGCLAPRESNTHTYDHVIATLALTEAYALTGRRMLRAPTVRAHEYMYALRNPGAAWRYAPTHPEMMTHENDVSVTGWAILAMTLAKDVEELPFDADALEDALVFLDEMTDETGRTGYIERGGPPSRLRGTGDRWDPALSESMTAVGVLCRIFADPALERPGARDVVAKGVERILERPLVWDDDSPGAIDFYYWYYATYALHQYSATDEGRDAWRRWEADMVDAVLRHQVQGGEERGSWAPQVDPWGSVGGRVYSTALLTLCVEVFYRYDTVMGR